MASLSMFFTTTLYRVSGFKPSKKNENTFLWAMYSMSWSLKGALLTFVNVLLDSINEIDRLLILVPVCKLIKTESEPFSGRVVYIWQTYPSLQTFSICSDLVNSVENTKSLSILNPYLSLNTQMHTPFRAITAKMDMPIQRKIITPAKTIYSLEIFLFLPIVLFFQIRVGNNIIAIVIMMAKTSWPVPCPSYPKA